MDGSLWLPEPAKLRDENERDKMMEEDVKTNIGKQDFQTHIELALKSTLKQDII